MPNDEHQEARRGLGAAALPALLRTSPLPVVISRFRDGVVLDANEPFLAAFIPPGSAGGLLDPAAHCDPEDGRRLKETLAKDGRLLGCPVRLRGKSGAAVMHAELLDWDGEQAVCATLQCAGEQTIPPSPTRRGQEEFFETVADNVPVAIASASEPDLLLLYANQQYQTTFTPPGEARRGFTLGASDYLTKPVATERLAALLRKYVGERPTGRVLVVADQPEGRRNLAAALAAEGWTVQEAENGRDALEQLAGPVPQLILLDLHMPEMDGLEFIHEIHRREKYRSVPVVVLTEKDLTPAERARLHGAVERILRRGAYSPQELVREFRTLLGPRAGGHCPAKEDQPRGDHPDR